MLFDRKGSLGLVKMARVVQWVVWKLNNMKYSHGSQVWRASNPGLTMVNNAILLQVDEQE